MEDIKTRQTKVLELKNTMPEMKNILGRISSRLDTEEEEEKDSELELMSIALSKMKHRERKV